MENVLTINIKRDDDSVIPVSVTLQYHEEDGTKLPIGVYSLTSPSIGELGDIAFHLEDKYEWEYCGDILTDVEVEQVVLTIQETIA